MIFTDTQMLAAGITRSDSRRTTRSVAWSTIRELGARRAVGNDAISRRSLAVG